MTNELPEKFVRLISECFGSDGAKWLTELPKIVGEIERNWALKVGKPFANLSYHFVAPCISKNGGEAVLKIAYPEKDTPIFNEAETLKLYDGNGAVKFLNFDENRPAMLLERLNPGETLIEVFRGKEERCVEIAIEVLRKLIRKTPEKHEFVRLKSWFASFEKAENTAFPAENIRKARTFYEELSSAEACLIHGDFHHQNILSAERGSFFVIDPKGVIGQIGYEIGVFLNNHVWFLRDDKNLDEKINRAVLEFSNAFEIAPASLKKWGYAQCVLSAWSTFQDNGENWKTDLALTEIWDV